MPGQDYHIIDLLGYPVVFGPGLWASGPLSLAEPYLRDTVYPVKPDFNGSRFFLLTDHHTARFCLPELREKWDFAARFPMYSIPPGEASKNPDTLAGIWKWLSAAGADRDSVLVNLGGGVVTDLGGFAAATYHRGIRYINIPTSLMAQADAAIGGKTGINLEFMKNQAGLFYDPVAVFIDPSFLSTLPGRHIHNGFAEIVKSAALAGGSFWEKISCMNDLTGLRDTIPDSIRFKSEVVQSDPLDHGVRRILNFGHTIGHAMESLSHRAGSDPLLHGEAVAQGMICEAFLSRMRVGLPESEMELLAGVLQKHFSFRPVNGKSYDGLIGLIKKDKKGKDGIPGFTLLSGLGSPLTGIECSTEEILASFHHYNRLCP